MAELEIKNAQITSTQLGNEDHGIFTAYVMVEGDGWGCGFGGFALDQFVKAKKERVGTAYGLEFIKRVLTTVGVEKWEDLPGKPVRVESQGLGGGLTRIGHFRKNVWFDPKALAEEFKD